MQQINRILIVVALVALLIGFFAGFQVGRTQAQSQPGLSMTSQQMPDGQYQMVISGPESEVARVCSFGDCSRTFASRLDASNYFLGLFGQANGLTIVPIPPAP